MNDLVRKNNFMHKYFLLFLIFFTVPCFAANTDDQTAAHIIQSTKNLPIEQRVVAISKQLLNKPYVDEPCGEGATGEFNTEPLFRFDAFDCETFVNTVLALTQSNNVAQFQNNLRNIIYTNGVIDFKNRAHFPSADWVPHNINNHFIAEITSQVAGANNTAIAKAYINRQNWCEKCNLERIKIPNISSTQQQMKLQQLHEEASQLQNVNAQINYIPLHKLFTDDGQPNLTIFNRIPNASIILFIEHNPNLVRIIGTEMNVSHMGLVIWKNNQPYLRAASSLKHQTTDLPLISYLHTYLNGRYMQGIALFQIKENN